jgi:hypothetical protein
LRIDGGDCRRREQLRHRSEQCIAPLGAQWREHGVLDSPDRVLCSIEPLDAGLGDRNLVEPLVGRITAPSHEAVYPLITLILWATQPVIGHLPLYVVTLIASLILAVLMNFLVMPLMLRLFARWLSPSVRLAQHEPLLEVPATDS